MLRDPMKDIERAQSRLDDLASAESRTDTTSGKRDDGASTVDLIRASDVTPEPIEWLWPSWLAAGKLHVFGGAPGTGKTTIAMALAATVTKGGRWPDGSSCPAGNVVIWSGEDDPKDTLVPRLTQSGASLDRVYFVGDIKMGDERRAFDPAEDMATLQRTLDGVGNVRLLIVDSIVSAITGDSHKNTEVRRGLQPLVDLAMSMRCALLGITHFSKGTSGRDPVERLTGSLAFGALARVVLVAAKHQEEGDDGGTKRVFLRAKSNIGPDDGGFEYDLHQSELASHPGVSASCVVWGAAVAGAARDLLAVAEATTDATRGDGGVLDDAKTFLREALANGEVPVKTLRDDAKGAAISWRTVERAKQALDIKATKDGMTGGWFWKDLTRQSVDALTQSHENTKTAKKDEDRHQILFGGVSETDGGLHESAETENPFDTKTANEEPKIAEQKSLAAFDNFGGLRQFYGHVEVEI